MDVRRRTGIEMSNSSNFPVSSRSATWLISLFLLSSFALPTSHGQLRERSRLKPPLLRLQNLGQRLGKDADSANANQSAANRSAAQLPHGIAPVAPPLAIPATPAGANPVGGLNPAVQTTPVPPNPANGLVPAFPPAATTQNPLAPPANPLGTTPPAPVAGTPVMNAQQAVPPAAHPASPINVASANAANPRPAAPAAAAPNPNELTPAQTMNLALNDAEASLEYMRTQVRDYSCMFIKRERVGGNLLPKETMELKVRNRVLQQGQIATPLSVYMKFQGPANVRGREVLYVEGQHGGKLLCKEGGTRGRFLPTLKLGLDSSFIMGTNRYPITQVGMTRLAERLIENGRSSPVDDCQIEYIHGAKVNGRVCSFLRVIRPTPRPGLPVGHNNVYCAEVFIDTELNMPVRFVAYDWPEVQGGKPRLIEEYMYYNIKVNMGLGDGDFSKNNRAYRF